MPLPNQFNGLQAYRGDTGQPFQPRSGIGNWFNGNPEIFRQVPKYTPGVQNGVNNVLQQGFENLQNPYQGFDNISNNAINQFNTQTVPSLAERFTSLGGGQRSSAFQSALGGAGADLQSNLASMRELFGQQNRGQSLQQIGFGLQNQPDFLHSPKQRGWLEGLLGPLLGGGNYQGAQGGQQEALQQILKYLPLLLGI